MMILSFVGLSSGCAVTDSHYCDRAQRPFEFRTVDEIKYVHEGIPRLLRYIEADADIWEDEC